MMISEKPSQNSALNFQVNIGANSTARMLILKTLFAHLPTRDGSRPLFPKNMAVQVCPSQRGRLSLKKFIALAAMLARVTPRCTQWVPCFVMAGSAKEYYLPKIANGTLRLQAFGVTEPSSGTDTGALKTTAKRDGDNYIINGQKIWTSRAEYSDHGPPCPHHTTD